MQPDHDNRDPERNLATLAPLGAETVLKKENASHYGGQPEQEQGQHQDDTAPNHITFAANMRGQSPTAYQRHLNPPYENALSQAESQEESHNTEALDPRSHFLEMFGRNSSFHHLSEAERRRLGGVEYRAICLLSVIVPLYLFLWQFLGALAVGAYMARNHGDLSRQNRLNPWWIGIFFAISAFNNSGMSLLDANVTDISEQYDNPAIDSIPLGSRILDGLFQAICVRSGGFYVVSIASLQISLQVLYVVMMYIAVYPVVITMRNSNVYEERSLGIYADDPSANEGDHSQSSSSADSQNPLLRWVPRGRAYFVEHQLRLQLAHDLWWLGLAVIIISIIEAGNFTRDPLTYSVFNIIFETYRLAQRGIQLFWRLAHAQQACTMCGDDPRPSPRPSCRN
uniref:Potassium transport protein 1 n=1 Tax=Talaromyces marneffei PM1 TaxID=1077442 RepID=A0A093XW84_TALMA